MNLSFFIARRYLFSKRKTNFINIISILSMAGVAVSTAALIIVLSVFNGLEELLQSLNNSFDPPIKVQPASGKSFEVTPQLLEKVRSVDGVEVITEVIEDYAYLRYRDDNQAVTMKAVGDNFLEQNRIPQENIVEGELKLRDGDINYAIIGRGVQFTLSVAVNEPLYPLQVYYIKSEKSVGLDPSRLYAKKNIVPGGVFSIVQQFDENYIIVPLSFAQELLDYGNKRTSLEIKTSAVADVFKVDNALQKILGDDYAVLNHEEQHQDLYKLLRIEKLFAFLALTLLLAIGSINIFFNLTMLALDKKKDISVLSAMGANAGQISKVFLAEGALIGFLGTVVGLALGGLLCWIQLEYAIVSMGMETSITQGYPVKVKVTDFLAVFLVVTIITFVISIRPARMASRVAGVNEL